jgi:transcriptional regulator with XRE-family HTH domain
VRAGNPLGHGKILKVLNNQGSAAMKSGATLRRRPANAVERAKSIEDEPALEASALGGTIRRLRQQRKLSLHSLASRAEMSVSMLSQIERGISSPSLKSLTKVRLALGVPISSLFESAGAGSNPGAKYVRGLADRPELDLGPTYLVKHLLSPSIARDLQFMILSIPPGGGSGDMPYSSPGEKGGLVLEGSLRLFIGDNVVDVNETDSFQFDSSVPHHFKNVGRKTTRVLWIICQLPRDRHI